MRVCLFFQLSRITHCVNLPKEKKKVGFCENQQSKLMFLTLTQTLTPTSNGNRHAINTSSHAICVTLVPNVKSGKRK